MVIIKCPGTQPFLRHASIAGTYRPGCCLWPYSTYAKIVIVKAFYPLLLIVSYEFGVHHNKKNLPINRFSLLRALLEILYLFNLYALRCYSALRNLNSCHGISLFISLFSLFQIFCILNKQFYKVFQVFLKVQLMLLILLHIQS